MIRPRRVLLGAALVALGCTGSIDGDSGDPSKPPPGKVGPSPDPATVPAAAPLRRLTRLEYDNTIRDLLGVDSAPATKGNVFSPDQESGLSGFVKGAVVTGGSDARIFMLAAEQLGAAAAQKLATLLPCTPLPTAAGEQDACADRFISQFGRRAFRRPLGPKEVDNLRALYRAQRTASTTFEEAIGALVTGILQAPQFLYHWELGPNVPLKDGALVRFNSYEVASRLSYLFWASMPDDKLFAAADANQLLAPDRIAQEARRLLADEKAKDGLRDFHTQWLEIDSLTDVPKDESLKDFSPAVAQSMLDETRDFVASIFLGPQATGKLETLLTSPGSVIDANLAKIYGAKGPGAVTLDPAQRAGIFTHLAFLTMKAEPGAPHPVRRGDAVLRRALCIDLEIPIGVDVPAVAEPTPGVTTRERFSMHSMNPCATCHTIIDPVGFAFERYNAIGAYRTTEENKPIDSSGKLSLQSGDLTFKDAVELMGKLAQTREARACMATQWLRYAVRRREIPTEDAALAALGNVFGGSGYDLRELVVAVTKTRSFTHRAPSAGEVVP